MAKKTAAAPEDAAKGSAPAPEAAKETKPAAEKEKEKAPRKKKAGAEKPAIEPAEVKPAVAETPAAEKPVEAKPAATSAPAADGQAQRKKKKPGAAPRRGKKLKNHLRNIQQKLLKEGPQPLKKAVATLKSLKRSKMDETVEIHVFLGVDPTQSDQLIRGSVSLPNGIGKSVRVLVFTQSDNVAKAKAAGADFAGGAELIEKIQKENWLDFDVALATQDMMGQVSRLGKVLGPRGLMPTPKAGTVVSMSQDVGQIVREFKAGKVEYRTDKTGNIHARVGKMSFEEDKLAQNIQVFVDTIKAARPSSVKGHFIVSTTISATQSPGIKLAI
jgi:large subunit ribosomal protein L1